MAPMKRPAASASSRAKKAKRDPFAEQCDDVIEALETLPEPVAKMLSDMAPHSLAIAAPERHAYQAAVVEMIEKSLSEAEAALKTGMTEAEAVVNGGETEQTKRESAVEAAKAALTAQGEDVAAKKTVLDELTATLNTAKEATAAAKKAEAEGNADLDATDGKRTRLDKAIKEFLEPLTAGTSSEVKGQTKELMGELKFFEVEQSLLNAAPTALTKEPANRGSFDTMVLTQINEEVTKRLAGFDATLRDGEPSKAARAAAVESAAAAEKDAFDKKTDAEMAHSEALAAEREKQRELRDAEKSLTSLGPEQKRAAKDLERAKKSLEEFEQGPKAQFESLKTREPQAEEEPSAESSGGSYYKSIDGIECDRAVVDACVAALGGQGDGRISFEEAKGIFEKLADANKITQSERWTMRYCLTQFNWTDKAQNWIVEEMKKVLGGDVEMSTESKAGSSYYETVDGVKCDRGIIDTCRESIQGQGDGRVSVEEAKKVWEKAADGGKVTKAEIWTMRLCLTTFNFTEAAMDYVKSEIAKVKDLE